MITCDAKKGKWPGVTPDCVSECKANVAAEMGGTANAASPVASYVFDALSSCAMSECASLTDYKSFVGCMGNACTDLAKLCFPN